MAALARHRPRPLATYTQVSQRSKYQYIRMKGLIRSALGAPPGGGSSLYSGMGDGMNPGRGLTLGMMGAPMSASTERFPESAGLGGFGQPLSAGLDSGAGSRRPSAIGMSAGPRQILPGQLPGPGQQRKNSMASVGAS